MRDETRKRILVVHEQDVVSQILTSTLETEGYLVTAVGDGLEGSRIAKQGGFDLMLVDLNMSHPNSSEFLRAVRSEKVLSRIPIAGLLLPGEAEVASRARQLGVDLLVEEPFDPEGLKEQLRRLMDDRSKAR